MGEKKSLLGRIITWTIVGVLAILIIKLTVRLFGFLVGLAGMLLGLLMFLVFTAGPIVLIGWLAVKAWQAFTRPPAA